ncbi:MAG: ankyrin repeat domain-containing protein [Sulfurimonadaceae bacterium]
MRKLFFLLLLLTCVYANNGWNALHEAVYEGDIPKVQALLTTQDINSSTAAGLSGLHIAVKKRDSKMIQFLLSNHANVDAQDNKGFSVLYYAVLQNNIPIAKLLLQHQADPNLENNIQNAPIHNIAYNNRFEMLELFLLYDVDINATNQHGMKAYDFAQIKGNTGMMLELSGYKKH